MELINKIKELQKSEIKSVIENRLKEFEEIKNSHQKIFSELCFCILTANSTAENCIRVQKEVEDKFEELDELNLAKELKEKGCRFHTKRAGYICRARSNKEELIKNINNKEEKELRNWIADNIIGLGMKESSHFLRNIGFKNSAIIDFHILDILEKEGLIKKPNKLDKRAYLKIEEVLENLAKQVDLNLSELDLYLWYLETGKVLK
jgi:N-glycosylase/DNA lyase